MSAAIKAEFRKLFTTRLWWILLLVMVAYLGFMSIIMAFAFAFSAEEMTGGAVPGRDIATMVYSFVNPLGYVFPLIIGSLLFTSEFRHKTITSTLLVEPNRTVFLGAKLIVGMIVGLVYGLVAITTFVVAAAPFLEFLGDGAYLNDPEVWKLIAGATWAFVLWSALGVAFGGLIVNQIAAIIVIIGVTQFLEPILGLALVVWEPTQGISRFLPAAAGSSIVGENAMDMGMGAIETLSRFEGSLVLLAYIAFFAILARLITLQRDIG